MTAPNQPGIAPGVASIVDGLAHFAALQPERPAYIDAQGSVTYGALYVAARRGAAWLAQQGVRAGDTVALPLDTHPAIARQAMEMLYAIAYVGGATLPLYPEVPLELRVAQIGQGAANWLIASGSAPEVAGARTLDPRSFAAADPRYDAQPAPRGDRADAPALFLFTSGTTGSAKYMLPTHQQLYGNVYASARAIGSDAGDRLMSAIPWPSGVGMRYLLRAHAVGAAFVAIPLGETRTALSSILTQYQVTQIALSPWQLRRLLQSPAPPQPLPPLRTVHLIGDFISAEELGVARALISPNVIIGYGCYEIGAATVLGAADPLPAYGCVGRLAPGMEARVTGAQGELLAPGETGELAYRAAWMCTGYPGSPEATRERFRDGWFYPGDIGSIDAAGFVTLRGRTQEVINYGGLKIWPGDIESILKQHPDVLDAALVGMPDAQAGQIPTAFLVPRTPLNQQLGASLSDEALRAFCATRIDASRIPPVFVAVAEIPRNESDKIMRDALIAAYQQAREIMRGRRG